MSGAAGAPPPRVRRRAPAWRLAGPALALAVARAAAGPGDPATAAAPAAPVATAVSDSGLAAGALLLPARVSMRPDHVRLGEPVLARAWVLLPRGTRAQWLPPDTGGAFTWGTLAARRIAGSGGRDTLLLESRLQIFATGPVSVPGPRFRILGPGGRSTPRLPAVRVTVDASPGVADSNARLHALRAPLEAPWWERVPWTLVVLAAGLIAAVILGLRLRRRLPKAEPARAAARPPRDAAEIALGELEALRRLELPRAGRFADHALALTRIARRFLEATAGTPRPGDTTPELVLHLEAARLEPDQVARLSTLLRAWDQVKFARQASTPAECERAEQGVEELARRRLRELQAAAPPAGGKRVA
jgi:hypothetical protein